MWKCYVGPALAIHVLIYNSNVDQELWPMASGSVRMQVSYWCDDLHFEFLLQILHCACEAAHSTVLNAATPVSRILSLLLSFGCNIHLECSSRNSLLQTPCPNGVDGKAVNGLFKLS